MMDLAAAPARRGPFSGLVAVGATVLLLALCEIAGWPFLRHPVQDAMTRGAGVPVKIDDGFAARFFWHPRLTVGHLTIDAPLGMPVPYLLDAKEVVLQWRWSDLWRWQRGRTLRIEQLRARELTAHLMRDAQGRATWALRDAAPAAAGTDDTLAAMPRFGELWIGSGQIHVDDRLVDTRLKIVVKGGEGSVLGETAPGYEVTAVGDYRKLPVRLLARAGGALPLLMADTPGAPAAAVALHLDGEIGRASLNFDGTAAALIGAQRLDGDLRVKGPSLAAVGEPIRVTLPRSPPFDLVGHLSHDPGTWHLRADSLSIGRSRLAADMRYNTRSARPLLSGKLTGTRLALADLGPAVGTGTEPGGNAAPKPRATRVLPERRFDLPSLRAMDANIQVAIDEFDFGSEGLAPLRNLQTQVLLQAGVLQLQDLKATVAGGQVSGSTQFDGTAEPATWSTDLHMVGIDVAGWVRAVRKPPATTTASTAKDKPPQPPAGLRAERQAALHGGDRPVRAYVTGALQADVQAKGAGRSTAEILGSLEGKLNASLKDGTLSHLATELAGLDVAQALGVAVRGDESLPLRCAHFGMNIDHGVATARNAVIDSRDSTLRVDGQIDLRSESLNLRAVVKPKDFSLMSLRTPLLVTGTLADPTVSLDKKHLATRALAAVALGAVAGPAALLAFVDPGSRDGGDPCAAAVSAASAPAR